MSQSVKSSKTTKSQILPNGDFRMDIIRGKPNGQSYEEFRVSGDGNSIWIRRGTDPEKKFTYDELPEKHWNKYHHAYLVVNNFKEKTPKITSYFSGGYWKMYENGPEPNFEMYFYQSERQYTYLATKKLIRLTEKKTVIFEHPAAAHLPYAISSKPYLVNEIEKFLKKKEYAQSICKSHEEDYPILYGKRPTSSSR